jgi:putative copper export protein
MLSPSWPVVVLWLHITAATIWIGGQVVVAAVIPMLRAQAGLATAVGRRYQAIAWPAFAVLVLTGVENVRNAGLSWSHLFDNPAGRTLSVKLGLVLVSGAAAAVHALLQAPKASRRAQSSPVTSAVLGSVSLLAALGAAFFGVDIANA